jgi:hypothetical protein
MVVGWPAEAPPQRDRLPGTRLDPRRALPAPHAGRHRCGLCRARTPRPGTLPGPGRGDGARWAEHGITSLAQFYTSKIKYDPDQFALDSAALEDLLRARGFRG